MKRPQNIPVTECLEPRLLLSGEAGYQLEITDLAGTPVTTVEVGQDFRLVAYAQDLRAQPQGVFAAYLDIAFNQAVAHPTGNLSYGADYPNGHSGSSATPGILDECGGFSGLTPLGGGAEPVFSMQFHADTVGDVTFVGNPADFLPGHDTLVYGSNSPVPVGQIAYGQVVLHVLTSVKPTAELAHPLDEATIDQPTINVSERYIDVTFADLNGSGLNAGTITDAGAEFTLGGAAAGGVTVDGAATLVSGTTYRYAFTGDFGAGDATVTFAAGSFADNTGNVNAQAAESFTVVTPDLQGPTANLAAPANAATIGDAVINARGYIDVIFSDVGGSGLNTGSITDVGAEFTLGGAAAGGVTVNGAATLVSGTTYRYTFTGAFTEGAVTVDFIADSVSDHAGNLMDSATEDFNVVHIDTVPPTADLADPANGASINDIVLNGRGFIDVTFGDTDGSGLDIATITDAGAEFALGGAAAAGVTVDGAATLVSGTTYRYTFTGNFGPGAVTVNFPAGRFADLQGNPNSADSATFTVIEVDVAPPTASLANPANGTSVLASTLNARDYIDVTFADVGPSGLDLATITDAGAEFTLGGANAAGVSVNGAATLVSGTTYRYTFTGTFTSGVVSVDYTAGAWADLAGNPNVAASQTFNVTNGAPEIAISGNGQPISAGDTTPGTSDGTDFGAAGVGGVVTRVFTIQNTGTAPLSLTGQPRVQVTGANRADFVVNVLPQAQVDAGASTTFEIDFSPSAMDVRTATITVTSDDGDEGSYTFDVQGFGGRMLAFGGKNTARYVDSDGDTVTVGLKDIGNGEIWFAQADPSVHADAARIVLNGTGVKSVLSLSAKGTLKRTSVTDIMASGPLKQITAAGLTVNGDILVDGTLGNLTVDVLNESLVDIRRNPAAATDSKAQLTLVANVVKDTTLNTHGQPIKSIKVWEWTDTDGQPNDSIISSWIGTLTTKGRKELVGGLAGDFEANLDLAISRDNLSAKLPTLTLGSASFAGTLTPDSWEIVGNIGALKAAAVAAGQIDAGTIKSITTTGIKGAVSGNFAADLHLTGSAGGVASTLGTSSIAGNLTSDVWDIVGGMGNLTVGGTVRSTVKTTGSMGALTFGAVDGADFLADVNPSAAGDPAITRHADNIADLDLTRSIKSLTIKGLKGAAPTTSFFRDSNFSAGSIGAVSLVNVAYDAGQAGPHAADQFGFWAGAIKSVKHKNLADKTQAWSWPKQSLPAYAVDLTIDQIV